MILCIKIYISEFEYEHVVIIIIVWSSIVAAGAARRSHATRVSHRCRRCRLVLVHWAATRLVAIIIILCCCLHPQILSCFQLPGGGRVIFKFAAHDALAPLLLMLSWSVAALRQTHVLQLLGQHGLAPLLNRVRSTTASRLMMMLMLQMRVVMVPIHLILILKHHAYRLLLLLLASALAILTSGALPIIASLNESLIAELATIALVEDAILTEH